MLKQLKINGRLGTGLLTALILGMIVTFARAEFIIVDIATGKIVDIASRKFAVLIAIDHYPDECLHDLQFCKSDTLALKEALIAGGFREEDIFLMTDDAKSINMLPTRENIRRLLATLEEHAKEGDMIFFFFSGHSGSSMNDGVYLLTVDPVTQYQRSGLDVREESQSNSPFTKYFLEGLKKLEKEKEYEPTGDSEVEIPLPVLNLPKELGTPMDEDLQRASDGLTEDDEPTGDSEIKDKRFVWLLSGPQTDQSDLPTLEVLQNDKATLKNLRKALELLKDKEKEDNVLIHWSNGHYTRSNDHVPVLLPTDSEVDKDQFNRLYVQEILDTLGRSKAKARIVAIDSCLTMQTDHESDVKLDALTLPKNTAFLLAAKPGFLAYESKEIQSSFFPYYIIRGLLGEADKNGDENGIVDLTELFHYVKTQLTRVKEFKMAPGLMVNGDLFDLEIVRFQDSTPKTGGVSIEALSDDDRQTVTGSIHIENTK